MQIFRERLKIVVEEKCDRDGITQEELATRLGLSRNRFRNYWTRATHMPVETLTRIADELEVDINWLCGRNTTPEWPKDDPIQSINSKLDKIISKS